MVAQRMWAEGARAMRSFEDSVNCAARTGMEKQSYLQVGQKMGQKGASSMRH